MLAAVVRRTAADAAPPHERLACSEKDKETGVADLSFNARSVEPGAVGTFRWRNTSSAASSVPARSSTSRCSSRTGSACLAPLCAERSRSWSEGSARAQAGRRHAGRSRAGEAIRGAHEPVRRPGANRARTQHASTRQRNRAGAGRGRGVVGSLGRYRRRTAGESSLCARRAPWRFSATGYRSV